MSEVSTAMRYTCSDCGARVVPIQGVNAVYSRGYWWCVHCVKGHWLNGYFMVGDFPAKGKMIPDTIMHSETQ